MLKLVVVFVIFCVGLYEMTVLVILPGWIRRWKNRQAAVRALEGLLGFPTLSSDRGRTYIRFQLCRLYLFQRKYAKSAEQSRILLQLKLSPVLLARVQQHLADALEAMGQTTSASFHRQDALSKVEGPAETALQALSRGDLLLREKRPAEAYDAFQEAWKLAQGQPDMELSALAKLLTVSFQLGKPEETLSWGEQIFARDRSGPQAIAACSMCGVAAQNLGRLDEALDFYRRGHELRKAVGDATGASRLAASLAFIDYLRGHVEASLKALEGLTDDRTPCIMRYTGLMALGEPERALSALQEGRKIKPHAIPMHEKRSVATYDLAEAYASIQLNDLARARPGVESAREVFRNDKMEAHATALLTLLLAAEGRVEECRAAAALTETLLAPLGPTSQRDSLVYLTQAWLRLQDGEAALSAADRYLQVALYPVNLPGAMLRRGDALALLGRTDEARAEWQRAADSNVDGVAVRDARQRLH